MSDQWDEKAREIALIIATDHFGERPMIAFPFENRCQKLIAAALRDVYARGVEDSAACAVGYSELSGQQLAGRIRALKGDGK